MNEGYPAKYESRLTLKNGRAVLFRPILQTDKPLIVDLLNKLSPDAVYLRFLRPVTELPEKMLFQLTHINYESNFALVAVIEEHGKDSLIAVARYGYDTAEKATDFAIAVRDDWQHLGLGKYMLDKILSIGREHGIFRFVSVIDSTNHNMKRLLRTLAYKANYSHKGGAIQVEVLV
jgi:acetyltransferase